MAETFKCPACSAPLEYEGKTMQKCRFCGSNVIVPASVLQSSNVFGRSGTLDFGDLSALTGKALHIAEIQRLLQNGQKINAIKVFRETFGSGLKEAKDAVEAMERGESVDVSGMQIVTQKPPMQFKVDEAAVKKVGFAVGGTFIAVFAIIVLMIIGALALMFFSFSRNVSRSIETFPQPAPSVAGMPSETSIAEEVLKFGGEGVGAGKFKDNRTVAVDAQGRIFSADYMGGRIQVFDAGGTFETQFTADTTRTVDELTVDRKGNLFVLQGYDVYRLNSSSGENMGKTRVDFAADMAVGLDGKIYVAARRGGIHILGADGTKLKTVAISKDFDLDMIEQIAVDGAGNLFLMHGRTSAIFKLSPEGKLLTRFGGIGRERDKTSKSMFESRPHDLAVDSKGRLYVCETSRVSIFDADGNYLNEFKTSQAFGLKLNNADEVFIAARPFVVKYKLNF